MFSLLKYEYNPDLSWTVSSWTVYIIYPFTASRFHVLFKCSAEPQKAVAGLVNMVFSADLVLDVSEALKNLFTVLYSGGRGRLSDMSV